MPKIRPVVDMSEVRQKETKTFTVSFYGQEDEVTVQKAGSLLFLRAREKAGELLLVYGGDEPGERLEPIAGESVYVSYDALVDACLVAMCQVSADPYTALDLLKYSVDEDFADAVAEMAAWCKTRPKPCAPDTGENPLAQSSGQPTG